MTERRDAGRQRASRLGRPRRELRRRPGSPGYRLVARRRVEPHRPHRAGPGRARRARLDRRRGDRRQPHARPLHADDAWTAASPSAGAAGRWASAAARRRRLELDPDVIDETQREPRPFLPAAPRTRVTHAWGGPIDVSPTHLPIFGSRGRIHHGFGFTGNGVGPSYLGGEILAQPRARPARRAHLARDRRARPQAVPARAVPLRRQLAHPARARAPGRGRGRRAEPGPGDALRRSLPRRLGMHLPR